MENEKNQKNMKIMFCDEVSLPPGTGKVNFLINYWKSMIFLKIC